MILDKFFNFNWGKDQGASVPLYVTGGWMSNPASTGENISEHKALDISSVYACCQIKGNAVGKLPIEIYQRTDKGNVRIKNHPVSFLLETRPNPNMTPYEFKTLVTVHRNLYGVAYIRISFDSKGRPNGLYPLLPPRVSVVQDTDGNRFYIDVIDKKNQLVFNEDEIIKLNYLTYDGLTPRSPIKVARESIALTRAQQQFLGEYFINGNLSRGVIKLQGQLNKDAKDKVRAEWLRMNSGLADGNAHKVAVLDGGMEYESLQVPPEDLAFLNMMNFQVQDIARVFGVPKHKLGLMDQATYSNIEAENMAFVSDTVMPEAISWEEELTYKLFTEKEQQTGLHVKFNLTSALRGDSVSRATYYKELLSVGVFSINEIRQLEQLDKIASGDEHLVLNNYIKLSQVGDQYANKTPNGTPKT